MTNWLFSSFCWGPRLDFFPYICQIKRAGGALEAIFSLKKKQQHIFPLLHMEVHAFAVQHGSKWQLSVRVFAAICQQPGSNSVQRCLVQWNQSWRAERINAENRSETYRSVASTSPFSSSGDSDRSGCASLKSGRCTVASGLIEAFIIIVTAVETEFFTSLICFYWLNQCAA